jgi:hypothetical protein
MHYHSVIGAVAVAVLAMPIGGAKAADHAKYPEWKGAWDRYVPRDANVVSPSGLITPGGQPSFDQTKPWGLGQGAPLTPEYRKVAEDSIADQATGGQGNNFDRARCMPTGMPHMMTFGPLEFAVTSDTTYILIGTQARRIFTDGREWPEEIDPTYAGYSIGRWIDTDGDGVYDLLEAETRGFKGPRVYDATGLPLHFDNQSIFKERFYLDKADPKIMHDEVTVIDHALTRPWTVDKRYQHDANPRPKWSEGYCVEGEGTGLVALGKEMYVLRADGLLMPAKKDQPPPDLRYFKQSQK